MSDGIMQYIGARYVPTFYNNSLGTPEWQSGVAYEPLTIVTYNNNSYTSRKPVPAEIGNPSANPEYWAQTGVYNAQIGQLQNDVSALQQTTSDLADTAEKIFWYTPEEFGAVGDGTTDDGAAFQAMFDAMSEGDIAMLESPVYKINTPVVINKNGVTLKALAGNNLKPVIYSDLTTGALFTVTGPGFRLENIRFNSTGPQDSLTLWDFNLDSVEGNGNVDAWIYNCIFHAAQIGVTARGRNLNVENCIFGSLRRGVNWEPTIINTENRGHAVRNCRFHGSNIAIYNNINLVNSTVKNLVIENNICDGGTGAMFYGYSGNVVIKGNSFFSLNNNNGLIIYMIPLEQSGFTSCDIIESNNFYLAGSNTGAFRNTAGALNVVIKGNVVQNCQRAGIFVASGGRCVVTDNVLIECQPSSYAIGIDGNTTGICANNNVIGSASALSGGASCTTVNNTLVA